MPPETRPASEVILDTNIVLDLLLFRAPPTQALHQALTQGQLDWIATDAMRQELVRVLHYAHLQSRLAFYALCPAVVLAAFDAQVRTVAAPGRAPYICRDADDQKFIDLAFAQQSILVSKDKAVLCMKKRLQRHGATVVNTIGYSHNHCHNTPHPSHPHDPRTHYLPCLCS